MKTMVEVPDDLYRRAKAEAALRGPTPISVYRKHGRAPLTLIYPAAR